MENSALTALLKENLSHLSNEGLFRLVEQAKDAIEERRLLFIETLAAQSTMSQAEAEDLASKGRQAFTLPINDWALVRLTIVRHKHELAMRGAVKFWPIVEPRNGDKTEEYLSLFENPRKE